MQVAVANLDEGTTVLEFIDSPETYRAIDPSLHLLLPVEVYVTLYRTGQNIVATGTAATVVGLSCGRCLDSIEFPIKTEFTIDFRPKPTSIPSPKEYSKKTKAVDEDGLETIEQDIDATYYSNEIIDLSDEIRQQIELSVPIKPLCKDDCLGLCPICGTNLNKGKCSCPSAEGENPFIELKRRIKFTR
jgi:uncharacterized protein